MADVVLENFRAGVLDRLGLGYEALAEANSQAAQRTDRLRVTSPTHGSTFHLDPVLRASYQRLRLAGTADGFRHVRWLVDGEVLAEDWTNARWPLAPGAHRIQLEGWDKQWRRWQSRPVTVHVRGAASP